MNRLAWYSVDENASDTEVEALCRTVLRVLWPHLVWFERDVAGLADEADTAPAVACCRDFGHDHGSAGASPTLCAWSRAGTTITWTPR
jgi:hypothetical protein